MKRFITYENELNVINCMSETEFQDNLINLMNFTIGTSTFGNLRQINRLQFLNIM